MLVGVWKLSLEYFAEAVSHCSFPLLVRIVTKLILFCCFLIFGNVSLMKQVAVT